MSSIKYVKFNDLNPDELIPVLNEDNIRSHLISHELFNGERINEWVQDKLKCDALRGCKIRAVYCNDNLVGWCGIQKEKEDYELAIVISKASWGIGISIFEELIRWSKELGHEEVLIHLLETRPEYKFLKRKSIKNHTTKMYGRNFHTYHIAV